MKTNNVDRIHGPVVESFTTETAWVFVHRDGFREVIWLEEMEVQETV